MKERPLLMADDLVLATERGEKTETRRPVKRQPSVIVGDMLGQPKWYAEGDPGDVLRCPFGDVGDRLWLRHAWRSWDEGCNHMDPEEPCTEHCHQTYVAYRCDPRHGMRPKPDGAAITYLDESTPLDRNPHLLGPWRPSIHMPRWAARTVVEIVEARIERVQSITEEGVRAEGLRSDVDRLKAFSEKGHVRGAVACQMVPSRLRSARDEFADVWERSYPGSWARNDWVWVIRYKPVIVAGRSVQ